MCLSPNGLLTRTDELGFIPILVKRMFDMRKITKKKMLELKKAGHPDSEVNALDVEQLAFKIALNSFYGICALPYFKYYDSRIAEAVTSTGQLVIKSAMKYLNEIMNKIMQTKGEVRVLR
jgi:DNA polymerase elongation subunit (family B)